MSTCDTCFKTFHNSLPTLLDCGHNICKRCLQRILQEGYRKEELFSSLCGQKRCAKPIGAAIITRTLSSPCLLRYKQNVLARYRQRKKYVSYKVSRQPPDVFSFSWFTTLWEWRKRLKKFSEHLAQKAVSTVAKIFAAAALTIYFLNLYSQFLTLQQLVHVSRWLSIICLNP